jgi:hypothetical protein
MVTIASVIASTTVDMTATMPITLKKLISPSGHISTRILAIAIKN